MMLLSFWNQLKKQLKKKLRWKRRWLNLAAILLVAGITAVWFGVMNGKNHEPKVWSPQEQSVFGRQISTPAQPEEEVLKIANQLSGEREAFIKKAYVCGDELQLIGTLNSAGILSYHKEHPALTVSLGEDGRVLFTEKIDDLSPRCKENAYFGLDAGGNLSLFEGIPGISGSSVIRTFFQLNIEHLESSLPRETVKQLYRGIRVMDLDDYNSVLSTLSDFAIEETERAMQSTPAH
ncbi:BofC C-terminal domain-containing protein [Paenibacillus cremeus]|uniref:Bypass-of-forespore protein C n=1 Tax=Paenibacillus cremeus TaxID=2163881 RepID=A0A559KIG8_9BACL|nr:BofC C-terminal domain-containing protein [Paenibacillus cremeus]TVY11927.1 bypass-of-forespore protein C [Paenibacillus cremeus]